MKKFVILLLTAVMILAAPCAALASELELLEGDELIQYSNGNAGDDAEVVTESETERDPGEYTTAPNGYAYTAPKVPDNTLKIYDFADLIDDDEEVALRSDIERAEKSRNCTVLVVTTRNTEIDPNYDVAVTRAYAQDFFEANMEGLKYDALILCIDMKNRVIYTVGYGRYAEEKYVNFHEEVYNDVVSYASNGDYGQVVRTFAQDVYKLDNWVNALIPTAGSLLLSAALAFLAMFILMRRHKHAEPAVAGAPSARMANKKTLKHDVNFLGRHTTSRRIQRETSSGGGGGGGFSGGTFSSGGGHSTSGGGGHF